MSVKHKVDSIKEIREKQASEQLAADNSTALVGMVIALECRLILIEWGVTL